MNIEPKNIELPPNLAGYQRHLDTIRQIFNTSEDEEIEKRKAQKFVELLMRINRRISEMKGANPADYLWWSPDTHKEFIGHLRNGHYLGGTKNAVGVALLRWARESTLRYSQRPQSVPIWERDVLRPNQSLAIVEYFDLIGGDNRTFTEAAAITKKKRSSFFREFEKGILKFGYPSNYAPLRDLINTYLKS